MWKLFLTSNNSPLIEIIRAPAPQHQRHRALRRRLPRQIQRVARLGRQTLGGDVERVGVLGEREQRRGKEREDGGEAHGYLWIMLECNVRV